MSHPWVGRLPPHSRKPPWKLHVTSTGDGTFSYVGAHVEVAKGSPGWLREQVDKLLEKHDVIFLPANFTAFDALCGLWVWWSKDGERFEVKTPKELAKDIGKYKSITEAPS